jgi:hypothetical protein
MERLISRFWRAFFGYRFGLWGETVPRTAWADLTANMDQAAQILLSHIPQMGRQFKHGLKNGDLLDASFWSDSPAIAKPLTGYAHMFLENSDYSRIAWAGVLELLEALVSTCR